MKNINQQVFHNSRDIELERMLWGFAMWTCDNPEDCSEDKIDRAIEYLETHTDPTYLL